MSEGHTQFDEITAKLQKKYGHAIMHGKDIKSIKIERVSTGSLALDIETGGGLPCGRMTEFFGKESCGKSTMALKVAANVQKLDRPVVWIDAEGTFDPIWAKIMGVDLAKLILCKPLTGEEAGDILVAYVQSGECGLVVLDSVGCMLTADDQEKSMVDDPQKVGGLANLVTRLVKKTNSALNTYDADGVWNNCIVLLLNQIREDLKIRYGNPETAPGGHALRHLTSIIVRMNRGEWIEEGEGDTKNKIGHVMKFRTDKNKTYAPHRESQFNFYFSGAMKGQVDTVEEVMRYGILKGIIKQAGKTYQYEEVKAVGRESFLTTLKSDGKLIDKIRNEVLKVAFKEE